MEQREGFLGKKERQGRWELRASGWDLLIVVAIDELRAIVASAQAKEKESRADGFRLKCLKGHAQSGVILVVASQFASVDTIPLR